MLSFLSSLVFGKERAISSKKVTKAPKDFIQAEEERMPPKMTTTYHTCLQASLHKHKAAGLAVWELPLYKGALCACSLALWQCRMVMGGGHMHIVFSKIFVEHGACL